MLEIEVEVVCPYANGVSGGEEGEEEWWTNPSDAQPATMQVSAKIASRERPRTGTNGSVVLNSTITKVISKMIPAANRAPMYGVVHNTKGAWFNAKLTSSSPVTPVIVPQ